jgi:hypothetical protein
VVVNGRIMLFELLRSQVVEAGMRPHCVAVVPPRFRQLRVTMDGVEFAPKGVGAELIADVQIHRGAML